MKRNLLLLTASIACAYYSIAQPCGSGNTWLGITNDWFVPSNWCTGAIPVSTTDVNIPPGTPNQPVINASGAVCHSINISSGASLTINGSNILSVSGDWTNTGTLNANNSTVSFTANTAVTQTLTGNTSFYNISKPNSGSTLSFGSSTTTIGNNLSIAAGSMSGGTSTIIFTGNAASLQGNSTKDFYNLEISNGAILTQTAGTNVNVSNSYKNNGTFIQTSARSITFQTASQTLSGSGVSTFGNVTVAGPVTINAGVHDFTVLGTFNLSGASGNFNGGSARITFSGSTASLGSGPGTINFNNVTISGTLSNPANKNFGIAGNWINNGSYDPGDETITFNGASQTIGGSAATIFNNLNIGGIADKILEHDITITNALTLANRNIDANTNSKTVYVKGTLTRNTTGHIIGNLKKDIPAGSNITTLFEVGTSAYAPATINFPTVTGAGSVTARTNNGDHPNIGVSTLDENKSVNRYWTLTNNGIDGSNYDVTFEFAAGDVDGAANTNNFKIGKYSSSAWMYPATTNVDATHIQATDVNGFGDFAIAEVACIPPSISDQPLASQSICQNEASIDLAIVASGDGLSYQWYVDNDNNGFDGDPVGSNGNSFTPTTNTAGTSFYYCMVAGCGTAISDYATVSVRPLYTWYLDADGDGFGDAANSTEACTAPVGYVIDNTDCNDDDNTVHPGAAEICDEKDNDCNGTIDAGIKITFYRDADEDGFGDATNSTEACTAPVGYVIDNTDCNDDDNTVYPGAAEICDEKDNDCNGSIDDNTEVTTFFRDADGDGYGSSSGPTLQSCSVPAGYVSNSGDCDDGNADVHPGAPETCDGNDNNCDGQVDEGFDVDGDGYKICEGDCNDNDASVYPGAAEICDDKDNNCNGQIDEGVKTAFYRDADGDGYGNGSITTQACAAPDGYVSIDGDCDDTDAAFYPNAAETCDGKDNNCDGLVDNNVQTTTWYRDSDGDGYGSSDNPIESCSQPPGYVNVNNDCDDSDPSAHPAAPEICDGKDNNCNGQIDENVANTYYKDADGDGYGNQFVSVKACINPSGYVSNNTDCNDNNSSIYPGAKEICGNGIDENCNGQADEACITTVKVCTYNQSTYDNNSTVCVPNGISSAGQIMLTAVDAQPGDSVIFGSKPSGRFFTLRKSDIQNGYIYKLLPGHGPSRALKGYSTFTSPATWNNVPMNTVGVIQNELLAQTITLFFNLQLSPQLSSLPLNTNVSIRKLTVCVIQGNSFQVRFTAKAPMANCLKAIYGSQGITVGNLYELANDLLGNTNTCNVGYADVNDAVKYVNELFNGCVLVNIAGSANNSVQTITTTLLGKNLKETAVNEVRVLKVTTSPNPFRNNLHFNIVSPETGKLKIVIYDVSGIKQGELEQDVIKNIPATILFRNEQLRQGVLFYRVSINNKTATGKIMQVK